MILTFTLTNTIIDECKCLQNKKTFSLFFILHGVMSKSGKNRKMKLVILRENIIILSANMSFNEVGEQMEEEEEEAEKEQLK